MSEETGTERRGASRLVRTAADSLHCPTHTLNLLVMKNPAGPGRIAYCPREDCQYAQILDGRRRQDKLPGLDPGVQSHALRISERALIQQCEQWATVNRHEVLLVGQMIHYVSCPHCRYKFRALHCPQCEETFKPHLLSGSTPGTPDMFVSARPKDARGFSKNDWKGLEAKENETSAVREEQQRLASLGLTDVFWTLEMFKRALHR